MIFTKKRILALLLCLAAILSLLPMSAWAADTTRVYCVSPENWETCSIYWWGTDSAPQWPGRRMRTNQDGVYYYDVPSDAQGILFNNGSGQQTPDLAVPQDDYVQYLVEENTWVIYGQSEAQALYIVAGFGSLCGSEWDPSDRNNQMTDEDGDGIYTKTYENVAAGTYELKVTNGSWSKNWGDPVSGANYVLTVGTSGTDVTVAFDSQAKLISVYLNGYVPQPTYSITAAFAGAFQAVLSGNDNSVTKTGSNAFKFEGVTPGTYSLTFSAEGYVARTYEVTVEDKSLTVNATLNLQGDINSDGKVNIGDAARLYAHVRGNNLLTDYALVCADYSGDGSVNVGDTAKLYSFVRSQKPPLIPDVPVEPDTPDVPDTPEEPDTPDVPDTPEEPDVPDTPEEPDVPQTPVNGVYVVGKDTLPYSEDEIYQQIFDPNTKLEIDLDMSDKELQKLQDDYERYRNMGSKSPIYRMGTLTLKVTTARGTVSYIIEEVGARMKGNTSRTSFYNKDEGIYKYIHFKFDFQETFDDEAYYGSDSKVWATDADRDARKDRTFAGLEKLEMRWNKLYDSTYLKESYAYDIYRSEGVLAPQCNIGVLNWSGARMGIYTVQEPVDKLFIERNIPKEDQGGDLYKLGWTNEGATFTSTNSIGAEDEDKAKFYVYDIKTNKKKTDHSALINLINTLNSGKVTKESYASVVDVDNFLRFAAVSYFMGNPDDLRNNYNNCYVYFLKSSGKAVFIPYDYDRCLGINREWNPNGNSMTKDDPYGNGNQKSPVFRYSVDKGGYYTQEYTQVLLEVAENELLKPESFENRFNIAKSFYANLVKPERNLNNASGRDFSFDLNRSGSASGGDNMSFRDYINAKMSAFRGYMGITDPTPSSNDCYVLGDFNSWSVSSNYAMTQSGSLLTYTLQLSSGGKFKVYDNQDGTWMGSECITEDTTVSYDTDHRTNILLSSGSYRITYDPQTRKITITNK